MRRNIIVAALFLSCLTFGAWMVWSWWAAGEDPQVARVKAMQQDLFANVNRSSSLTEQQRREQFETFREEVEKLGEAERETLFREFRASRQEAMAEQIHRFTQMTPAEKTAYLDEQIDRMESFRQQRQRSRSQASATANATQPQRSGPRSGRWQNMTDEQREQRRRSRLDESDPTQRAEFAAYFEALRERRKERGLQDVWRGRPF